MRQATEPIVALLIFSVGAALSLTDFYAIVLFWPLAVFVIFYVLLLVVVIHRLAVRQNDRSQIIGKGVLAVFVWLAPSFMVLFVSIGEILTFMDDGIGLKRSRFALLVIAASSVAYGLTGWWLVRWVKNPHNEGLGIWERKSWPT